jgi:RNA polymerase sigma-70 factor (ECF subfamily)
VVAGKVKTGGDVEMPELRVGRGGANEVAPITCAELVEKVTDYLEEVLAPAEVARIHEHLSVCDSCETYLTQVRSAIRVTCSTPSEEMTHEAEEKISRIYQRWLAEKGGPGWNLQALRRGDELEFQRLVKRYHSPMLRLALIYSPSREVAEETVQETWIAVLRGLDGFAGRATLRTWMCRILVNNARRRSGLEARSTPFSSLQDDEDVPAVAPDQFLNDGPYVGHWATQPNDWSRLPEDKLLSRELQDVVSGAISQLPPAQRTVITLRDVEGWTVSEVSNLLNVQDGYQRVLLHRARIRVRTALELYLRPPPTDC